MRKLVVILIFLSGYFSIAQNQALFEKANSAYADGDYQKAAETYSQILENGEVSAAVHYNLANSYYKLNEVAPSIYHYEKALQYSPGDEDVKNNLVFARTMAIDAIEEPEEEGLLAYLNDTTAVLTPAGWGWMAIFGMLLFVLFFFGYYFSRKALPKKIFFISSFILLFLSLCSAGIGFFKQGEIEGQSFAIVFSEEVEVRSEPNIRSNAVFTLHEGAKVKVTEDFQGWYEVELQNGSQGWLRQNTVKRL